MGPKPCGLQDMCHIIIICSPVDWVGICHAIITCSSGACQAHATIHAVSELVTYRPCLHYMQFRSLQGTCHVISTCRSGVYGADTMPSLNAISELVGHMPCPQLSLHTDLH